MSDKSLKEIWWEWHKKNPEVYELFKKFTFQTIKAGHKNYSAMAVIQRIRWHTEVETKGDVFKINNNHVPYYARLFAHDYPEHGDYFRMRTAKDCK